MKRIGATRLLAQLTGSQSWEIHKARLMRLSPEMESVIVTGHSDFGHIGLRSTRHMKLIRTMLSQFRLLFSCVSLIGLSDEAICIYYSAFMAGLSPAHAMNIVEGYRQRIRILAGAPGKTALPVSELQVYQAIGVAIYDIAVGSEMQSKRGA